MADLTFGENVLIFVAIALFAIIILIAIYNISNWNKMVKTTANVDISKADSQMMFVFNIILILISVANIIFLAMRRTFGTAIVRLFFFLSTLTSSVFIIWSTVLWGRLHNTEPYPTGLDITRSTASNLYVINIIFSIILVLLTFWAFYRLLYSKSGRERIAQETSQRIERFKGRVADVLTDEESGLIDGRGRPAVGGIRERPREIPRLAAEPRLEPPRLGRDQPARLPALAQRRTPR